MSDKNILINKEINQMTGIVVLNYNTYDATIECISALKNELSVNTKYI